MDLINMRIATLHSVEKDLAEGTLKDPQDLLDDFLQKEGIIPEHSYYIVENLVSASSAPVYEALLRDAALGHFDFDQLTTYTSHVILTYVLSIFGALPLKFPLELSEGAYLMARESA